MRTIKHKRRYGRLVEVYRNLHNGMLSIRDVKTRRVIGHAGFVALENVQFKVSEAGRQRVLMERRKNVHAVVRGYECPVMDYIRIETTARYDPYKYKTFVVMAGKKALPVFVATYAVVRPTGIEIRF